MTTVRRIAELKRDDMPFIIRLEDGQQISVDSGGSVAMTSQQTGVIASLSLMPPKTENIAFLLPLSPEFRSQKIWMISTALSRTESRDGVRHWSWPSTARLSWSDATAQSSTDAEDH
jgi:hypothetical protein